MPPITIIGIVERKCATLPQKEISAIAHTRSPGQVMFGLKEVASEHNSTRYFSISVFGGPPTNEAAGRCDTNA